MSSVTTSDTLQKVTDPTEHTLAFHNGGTRGTSFPTHFFLQLSLLIFSPCCILVQDPSPRSWENLVGWRCFGSTTTASQVRESNKRLKFSCSRNKNPADVISVIKVMQLVLKFRGRQRVGRNVFLDAGGFILFSPANFLFPFVWQAPSRRSWENSRHC